MGFVEYDAIMLVFHVSIKTITLCCDVHTILLIKCLVRCFCVYFWTPSSTKFGDNHVSLFGTTNGYVVHTLPLE